MNIFVTGGTGRIGRYLVNRLSRQGHHLALLSRHVPEGQGRHPGLWIQGDLLNPETYRYALKDADMIIHMAAVTHSRDVSAYYRINVDGTRVLAEAAEEAGVKRFFHFGTRAVGEEGGAYSHSKALADEIVKASRFDWVIFQPSEVYENNGDDPIGKIMKLVKRGPVVPFPQGDILMNPVYMEDLVEAVMHAVDNPGTSRKSYILSGPQDMTCMELVRRIQNRLGVKRLLVPVPLCILRFAVSVLSFFRLGSFVGDQVPRMLLPKSSDISQAVKDLDFHPRSIEEGISVSLQKGAV